MMNSMTMTDRNLMMGLGNMGMSMPLASSMMSQMPMMSTTMPGAMVPRCVIKMEKCPGGMKMICTCEDKTTAMMLQSLCNMMAGGMCSCCIMMNGLPVCCCNMTMGLCTCEMNEMGCTIACTSGDKACESMIQACCDCMNAMMMPGCTSCIMMNNMPLCCCVC